MGPLYVADLMGTAVFAASGALAACRKELDLLGVVVISSVTAIGGGTLRDLLLNRHPMIWMQDQAYLVVILLTALGTVLYTRWRTPPDDALAVADALGLGVYAIVGARIAESRGINALAVVLLGTMTGVAGGVIRDVLTNEVPMILRRGRIYATAAVAGIAVYLLLRSRAVEQSVAAAVGAAVAMGLRLASIRWSIELPVYPLRDPRSGPS